MKPLTTGGTALPDATGAAGRQGTTAAAALLFAGFAGFGAGAVNLATASSLLLSPAASGFAVAGGVGAALWGTSLLAWSVLSLRRGSLLRAGQATALLLGASVVHAASALAAMAAGPSGLALSHLTALLRSPGRAGCSLPRSPPRCWSPGSRRRGLRHRPQASTRCRTANTGFPASDPTTATDNDSLRNAKKSPRARVHGGFSLVR